MDTTGSKDVGIVTHSIKSQRPLVEASLAITIGIAKNFGTKLDKLVAFVFRLASKLRYQEHMDE